MVCPRKKDESLHYSESLSFPNKLRGSTMQGQMKEGGEKDQSHRKSTYDKKRVSRNIKSRCQSLL